jgi:hypothetical protein
MLLFGVLFPIGGAPAALGWLLLLPALALAWVLRTQTTVGPDQLRLRRLLGSRTLDWAQIKGVRFPKYRFARAVLRDGSEVLLPAVDFDRLRELARYSGGRIPDPYAMPRTEQIPTGDAPTGSTPDQDAPDRTAPDQDAPGPEAGEHDARPGDPD